MVQIDRCVYPQCAASIALTVYVYIQELPGTCSSLHVMHTHDNWGLTHIELANQLQSPITPNPISSTVCISILFSPFTVFLRLRKTNHLCKSGCIQMCLY